MLEGPNYGWGEDHPARVLRWGFFGGAMMAVLLGLLALGWWAG